MIMSLGGDSRLRILKMEEKRGQTQETKVVTDAIKKLWHRLSVAKLLKLRSCFIKGREDSEEGDTVPSESLKLNKQEFIKVVSPIAEWNDSSELLGLLFDVAVLDEVPSSEDAKNISVESSESIEDKWIDWSLFLSAMNRVIEDDWEKTSLPFSQSFSQPYYFLVPHTQKNSGWIISTCRVTPDYSAVICASGTIIFVKESSCPPTLLQVTQIVSIPSYPSAIYGGVNELFWYLALGTEAGTVHLMKSARPLDEVLACPHGYYSLTWQMFLSRADTVNLGKLHNKLVKSVNYHAEHDVLVSCSTDPLASLIVTRPQPVAKKYIFAIPKGVDIMTVSWGLHIIATASSDCRIKLWNPYLTQAPICVLPVSQCQTPVADLALSSSNHTLIVCYNDATVKIWDVNGCQLIQTISLEFPGGCFWVPSIRPLFLRKKYLIVAGKDHLACLIKTTQVQGNGVVRDSGPFLELSINEPTGNEDQQGHAEERFKKPPPIEGNQIQLTLEAKERNKLLELIRKGTPFCAMRLFKINTETLPSNLPLPSRLVSMDLSTNDPSEILQYLKPSQPQKTAGKFSIQQTNKDKK